MFRIINKALLIALVLAVFLPAMARAQNVPNTGNPPAPVSISNPLPTFAGAQPVQLLSNVSSATTGTPITLTGGAYYIAAAGTFGGSTVTISQISNGQTSTLTSFTSAPTNLCFVAGAGTQIYATVAGGTPSGLYVSSNGIGAIACPNTSVSQGTGGSSPWLVTSAPYSYTPVTGTQSALAVTTATGLTVPATATFATITPIGGAVNYSIVSDFTPTASNGLPLPVGQTLTLSGASVLAAAKFIDATGSAATLLVEYTK